ncbi:uncharacterized protein [Ptychodera flava]|uniref:uncharacterized protein isoform X1 n=1 Tax=Ptychodera flava TaxID=63121 RepID=UPI00396A4537
MALTRSLYPWFCLTLFVAFPKTGISVDTWTTIQPLLPDGVEYIVEDGSPLLTATFLFGINRVLTENDKLHITLSRDSHVTLQEVLPGDSTSLSVGMYRLYLQVDPPHILLTFHLSDVTMDIEGEYDVRLRITQYDDVLIDSQGFAKFYVRVRQADHTRLKTSALKTSRQQQERRRHNHAKRNSRKRNVASIDA